MRFGDAWAVVREKLEISQGKLGEYDRAWDRLRSLHYMQIATAKAAQIQQVIDDIQGYHPKKAAKNVLGHIYRFALANDIVSRNPMPYIALPSPDNPKQDTFTDEELQKVWDATPFHEEARWIIIMAYCGLRPGELRTIRLDDIHLDGQYMIGGIKTEQGKNRVIPIADRVVPVIRRQIDLSSKNGKLVAVNEDNFYDRNKRFLARIGVRYIAPRFCRHTFATRSAEANIAPAVIQEIMGHTKYQTTLHYTHIRTEKKVESVNKL